MLSKKEKKKIYMKKWREKNKEKVKEHFYKWYNNGGREKMAIQHKSYRKSPLNIFLNNVRSKTNIRFTLKNKKCEECGSDKNLQRHHNDYNNILDVRILCKKCHTIWHKNNNPIYPTLETINKKREGWMDKERDSLGRYIGIKTI